ncbi:MAG TPA: hypothetical protein PK675_05630 [Clostridia bacterium]|nr:hypothetical protein [Clostridia bacterium]
MKKTITLILLALIVATSLVTGTLAVYSVEAPEINSGNIIAKEFVFTASGSQDFTTDVQIAPTETVQKTFTVSNFNGNVVTGTDMNVSITVSVEGEIVPLSIVVTGDQDVTIVNNGTTSTITFTLAANQAVTKTFSISVVWNSTANDNLYMGKVSSIVVNATAVQG